MAVTSDASPLTSVTASPMESHDSDQIPIELKIPLPSSSACSDEEEEPGKNAEEIVQNWSKPQESGLHGIHERAQNWRPGEGKDMRPEAHESEEPLDHRITVEEVAQLVELEAYQKRRTLSAHAEIRELSLSCGLRRRLINTLSIAYGNMIDQYKTDDQAGFAGLFEAGESLKAACERRTASQEYTSQGSRQDIQDAAGIEDRPGIHMLPAAEQEILVRFITQIRTDPGFLSEKISRLSHAELTALTSSYHPAGIDFSILQNHSHGKSQFFSRDSQMMKLSRRMDNLHHFHSQDPFFALLYSVFDSSARLGSQEYLRRQHVWSIACAQTMIQGFGGPRPGSDEFAIASFDAFSHIQNWGLTSKMETYIMDVLAKGSFLVDASTNQAVNFKEPLETTNAKAAVAEADFFENALTDLFDILGTQRFQHAVPVEALAFAHAVLREIDDSKLRLRAQQFIVIRWYFATFISSIAVYPEVRGVMMTQYIGESARRMILQKLVVRLQEQAFDAILPWNHNALIKPEIRDGIMTIFRLFDPSMPDGSGSPTRLIEDEEASTRFLMLSPLDMIGLVQALYPDRLHTSDQDEPLSNGPMSDRPSTAGSSTLVAGSSDVGSAVVSVPVLQVADGNSSDGKSLASPYGERPEPDAKSESTYRTIANEAKGQTAEDFDTELKATCQRFRNVLARDGNLRWRTPSNSWMFLYYPVDGSTLSFSASGPEAPNGIIQGAPITTQVDSAYNNNRGSEVFTNLKTAVVKLLHQKDKSRISSRPVESRPVLDELQPRCPSDPLETLLAAAIDRAHITMDFTSAHDWWRSLQVYKTYLAQHPDHSFDALLQSIADDIHTNIDSAARVANECEANHLSLQLLEDSQNLALSKLDEIRNGLRIKMWYLSDVRHSATYEEALYVTRALRSMANSKKPKQAGSIANWARQRLRGSNIHDRAEAQTLEAMVAPRGQGGLSKLADEQVELTSRWLTRGSIENFCKGEERVHRFCHEIQRSVGKIAGHSLFENPVLWSSHLFKRERILFNTQRPHSKVLGSPFNPSIGPPGQHAQGGLHYLNSATPDNTSRMSAAAKARSPTAGIGNFGNNSQSANSYTGLGLHVNHMTLPPTPTSPPMSWSSNPFSSTVPMYNSPSPLPLNSVPSGNPARSVSEEKYLPAQKAFVEQTKRSLCSLLVSDLGYLLWNQGSETDAWVNNTMLDQLHLEMEAVPSAPTKPGPAIDSPDEAGTSATVAARQDFTSAKERPSIHEVPATSHPRDQASRINGHNTSFPFFSEAYSTLLRKMSLTHDPYAKLRLLYNLEDMILKYLNSRSDFSFPDPGPHQTPRHHTNSSGRSKGVPRTKATSLEEVIANCTERRAGTLRAKGSKTLPAAQLFTLESTSRGIPDTDDVLEAFSSIFRDPNLRPKTLFRDLQYIAAFVPAEILDQTAQGKAFWDAGLAALALKEDLCESMVSRADQITNYHISQGSSSDVAAANTIVTTTLRDAANLWLTTAKEGSPVAARELGLFYLTQPELIPRVTMPLSKAKDVYKSALLQDARAGEKEHGRLDPYTFAVVFHWMEIAANGGDKDAKDFLKGNGELSRSR